MRQAAKNIASPHQSWLVQKVSAIPMTKTCADGTLVFSETKSVQIRIIDNKSIFKMFITFQIVENGHNECKVK